MQPSTPTQLRHASPSDWRAFAACRGADTNLFFPVQTDPGAETQTARAKAICVGCPVRCPCLTYALTTRQRFGIFGGQTAHERHAQPRESQTVGEGSA